MEKSPPDMKLRISAALRERIEHAAKVSNRTMNAEIVSRLEFTFAVDVTVQDTGWEVGAGIDSPEMKAALLKQRLGSKGLEADAPYTKAEAAREFASLRKELAELHSEFSALKNKP